MKKEEINGLLEPHLEDSYLTSNVTITFITNQGLDITISDAEETEIYFNEESLQINTPNQTNLVSYSQIASVTISH